MFDSCKLPMDRDDFKSIRREQYLYVDKTALLESLIEQGKKYLLSCPYGSGKTLTLSTLTAMFTGQFELFKGLAAENWVRECAKHPYAVLNFDFYHLETTNFKSFQASLAAMLASVADDVHLQVPAAHSTLHLLQFFKALYRRNGPFVILIDNYDKPIIASFEQPKLVLKIYKELQNLYKAIDASRNYLKFVMLAGEVSSDEFGVFATRLSTGHLPLKSLVFSWFPE